MHFFGIKGFSLGHNHRLDRQIIGLGEFKVSLIVGGNRHDRTGAVFHQYKVGDINWNLLTIERIDAVATSEHPFLFGFLLRGLTLFLVLDLGDETINF